MAKYIYPAIFYPEKDGAYSVRFPDFESCYTSGIGLQQAMEMAQDVLCLTLYDFEEQGRTIPLASRVKTIKVEGDSFVSLVDCDTLEYRKFYDSKAVKKTLSIPSWLNTMAERENVNFSAVLQNALKEQLHVSE